MARAEVENLLREIYGAVPKPTDGERFWHELMVDSGTFDVQQTKRDILRLAEVAMCAGDLEMKVIVLEKWNRAFPENKYFSVELLVGVENEP